MPISPSSAFDTYTYVAALNGRLSAAPSSAVSSFHMDAPSPEDYFLHGESHATELPPIRLYPREGRFPRPQVLRGQARLQGRPRGGGGRRGLRVRQRHRVFPLP